MEAPRDKLTRLKAAAATVAVFALVLAIATGLPLSKRERVASSANRPASAIVAEDYGRLPLSFEPNQGQSDPRVRFLARGRGYALFLAPTEAVLALRKASDRAPLSRHVVPSRLASGEGGHRAEYRVVRMRLRGANTTANVRGVDQLAGQSNYFIGSDPSRWRTNTANYARVRFEQVYPGVDLVYHGTSQRQLEYDFVVAPGTDPRVIDLGFEGTESIAPGGDGSLILRMAQGFELNLRPPQVYQQVEGQRRTIEGRYLLKGGNKIGFRVARYNKHAPLVIDPTLVYSTYLGGSGNDASNAIAVDASGNVYVTGLTTSANFPVTAGGGQTALAGSQNAFVAKLNAGGTTLLYSTYLGGTSSDEGKGIAVDGSGNAYVAGDTASTDFPVTTGAFQTSLAGGSNAFVSKLNASGSALLYSTYLGGSGFDGGSGIAVDGSGDAFVTGFAQSADFPVATPAFQVSLGATNAQNAFVTKLNPSGSALAYSTYLGGSNIDEGQGIAVDSLGGAYVTGFATSTDFPITIGALQTALGGAQNAFVAKLNSGGSALLYSTYLGGSGSDAGNGIVIDGSRNAYVAGSTSSANFPVTNGAFQTALGGAQNAFITKLKSDGSALLYSTYLGGSASDEGNSIAVDTSGNAYIAGSASSSNFPTTAGAFQTTLGGAQNAFVTKLAASGSAPLYSTYLGGSNFEDGNAIAVDGSGNAYVTGDTASTNFPTTAGSPQTGFGGGVEDAFVSSLVLATPTPTAPPSATPSQTPVAAAGTATPAGLSATPTTSGSAPTPTTSGTAPTPTTPGSAPTPTTPRSVPTPTAPASTSTPTAAGVASTPTPSARPVGGGGGPIIPPGPPSGPSGSQISIGPAQLFFDPRPVGSASGPKVVTLSNSSIFQLHVYSVSTRSQAFAESDNCVGAVPAHGSCSMKVVFAPTAVGVQSSTLQVIDEVNSTPTGMVKYPQTVSLSGTGTDPGQSVFAVPDAISYAPQKVGTVSTAKTVSLNNMLSGTLHVTGLSASGDFSVTGGNCTGSIASRSHCIISVAFAPVKAGTRTGTLTIATDTRPKPLAVSLSGTAQMPAPTATPTRATPTATPRRTR